MDGRGSGGREEAERKGEKKSSNMRRVKRFTNIPTSDSSLRLKIFIFRAAQFPPNLPITVYFHSKNSITATLSLLLLQTAM